MEMVIVLAILSLLAALATPYARISIKREKEIRLRETLRTVRTAIDRFHADMDVAASKKENGYVSENGYPVSLQALVDGAGRPGADKPAGTAAAGPSPAGATPAGERPVEEKKRKRYLRALPQNPFAPPGTPFEAQWTFVSYQNQAPLMASSSYGMTLAEAQNSKGDIYDLHAVTPEIALDGTRYADW